MTNQTNLTDKKRVFGFDAIKALAAFFVVLYHVGMVDMGYRDGQYYYPTVVQVIWLFCACGVPLFFMVNGALTVHRNYDLKKSAVKAGRLVLAGLFWGLMVICLQIFTKNTPFSLTPDRLNYYWFLFTLAMLYIVNYVLSMLPRWCRWVVIVALLIYPFVANLAWDVVTLRDPATHIHSWRTGAFTLYGVVYLYAGDYFRQRKVSLWVTLVCAVVGLGLLAIEAMAFSNRIHHTFAAGNYCFPTIGALLLSIAVFLWVRDCDLPRFPLLKRFITFLGNNALGIYIFHLMLMQLFGRFSPFEEGLYVHPVVAMLITLVYMVLSAGISELIRRSPLGFLLKL